MLQIFSSLIFSSATSLPTVRNVFNEHMINGGFRYQDCFVVKISGPVSYSHVAGETVLSTRFQHDALAD